MYVKRQLVPFGEYIPFRGLISSFSSLPSLQPVDFTAGHQAVVFAAGKIRLGDVICYEVGFDNLVRSEVTAGANLLAVQSNDADFEIDGQLGETEQQTAMARIRAVESDRAVVYVSTTGESTIIAPDGRADHPQRHLAAGRPGWRGSRWSATARWRTGWERWPEYVIVMLTVLALAAGRVRERSEGGSAAHALAQDRRPVRSTITAGKHSICENATGTIPTAAGGHRPAGRGVQQRGTRSTRPGAAAAARLVQGAGRGGRQARPAALATDLTITPANGSRDVDPVGGHHRGRAARQGDRASPYTLPATRCPAA